MPTDLAITLVAAFAIFFLGILVYFHDRKSASNAIFFLISLATVFWAIANYVSLNIEPERVLFWIRLVLFFAAPHAVLFFIFTYNFPNRTIVMNKNYLGALLVLLFLTMGATVSPFVFSKIEIKGEQVIPLPGPLMPLFIIVVIGSLISGIFLIIKKYTRARSLEKVQWRLMLIGVSLSYIFLILTNFLLVILFKNTDFIIFGPVYMLPTFIGMSYAILRHHLLNVKTIATEILTFVILSISLFEIFASQNITELLLRISVFILFLIFGTLLIRSVLKEVEQREKLEELTGQLTLAKIDLEQANVKLKELDKLKSEFLGFASHQVKSPMAVIKGFAQLIADGSYGQVSEEAKAKAVKIKESIDRTIALVNNLLDLRKIEEGKMEFNFGQVDIVVLMKGMVEEFQIVAKAKGLGLFFEASAPFLKIKADEQKIRQVLQNLLDNSIKYTERGFVKVRIEEQGDYVMISVEDSGRGMSQDLIRKLFQRFVRDEQTKKEIQGTGLGLYIAKQIVTAHNGQIWAESDGEGRGSRFYVRLAKG